MPTYFESQYKDKKVLVTGNTGFKGVWLSLWLNQLGAKVFGASVDLPSDPNHYTSAKLDQVVETFSTDIRERDALKSVVDKVQPDYIFHLAAQALVKRSYDDPITTFETNAVGTANLLEALRVYKRPCVAVLITSDKCYENVETYYGYRESDRLGGKDPYSASKAAAEAFIHSYIHAYAGQLEHVAIGTARAGNVIGGGDWASDRLIPDLVRAWQAGKLVNIRRPDATRPWQHVLEPLSGYLHLGAKLRVGNRCDRQAYNFGPPSDDVFSVESVVTEVKNKLDGLRIEMSKGSQDQFHEAGLLKLCCDKAKAHLDWVACLNFMETIELTASWYREYYRHKDCDVRKLSIDHIDRYCSLAADRRLVWTQN